MKIFNQKNKVFVVFIMSILIMFAVNIASYKSVYAATKDSIYLNKTNVTLNVGKTVNLKISGTNKKVKWTSNKKSVATVSSKGKVKAISKGTATITAKVNGKKYNCKVVVYKVDSGDSKVDKKVRNIISKNIKASMSTAEKVKTIHDYIVKNCEYDVIGLYSGNIPADSYSARGVLLKKKAVCQGYAEAFQVFMDALNIPCQFVRGTANNGLGDGYQGHAWNIVKVDGKWYHIDTTWDDPTPDDKKNVRYEYFLINDKVMKKDHRWKKSAYKKCNSSNNKFVTMLGKIYTSCDSAAQELANNNNVQIIINKKACGNSIDKGLDLITGKATRYQYERHDGKKQYIYTSSKYVYGDYYVYLISKRVE